METNSQKTRKIRLDLDSIEVLSAEVMNPTVRGEVMSYATDVMSCRPTYTCEPEQDPTNGDTTWEVTKKEDGCGSYGEWTCGSCHTWCSPCTA